MALIRSSTGKILEENFLGNHIPLWDVVPFDSDRIILKEDSLVITGGDYIEMLINTPRTDFVMSAHLNFESSVEGDVCGSLMKSVTGSVIEAEIQPSSFYNNDYQYIKLERNEYQNVYFRVSNDGERWEDKGSTHFKDGHTIGFYNDSLTSSLELKQVTFCTSNFINVHGVASTDYMNVYDDNGVDLLKSGIVDYHLKGNNAFLDFSNFHFPVENVTIVINEGHPRQEKIVIDKLYGGDAFEFEPDLYFTIEDYQGNALNGFNLGEINQTEKHFVVVAHNEGSSTKHGTIMVESISSYDRGDEMAFLYSYGSDFTGESKSVGCTIIPGDSFKCVLVIKKDSKYVTIDDHYNFKLSFI